MKPEKTLVIGLDCSTTACKAVVWDIHGVAQAEGRCPIPLEMPRPNWYEQHAETWWQAASQALKTALEKINSAQLAALCIAPQRETFVPTDAQGHPLHNAIIWMDIRSRDLLSELDRMIGKEHLHQLTGKPLSANLSISKIFWMSQNEPQLFEQTDKFLDTGAFLAHRLTGYFRTGWGCVDPMGLFEMPQGQWSDELLAVIGISVEQLPEAYPSGAILGEITPQAARETGLPAGLPVVAGVGDGQATGLAANITNPGQAYLNLGTAVVSGTYAEDYLISQAFRTSFGAIPHSYILETVLLGGTYTISWFIDKFSGLPKAEHPPYQSMEDVLDAEINNLPPGAEGLMLVPYWNSVMNPYWDASASGIVVGWRGVHTLSHLYRAILEGIGYELRLHAAGVESALGKKIDNFIAIGGGSHSTRWCQILADITGKAVYRCTTPEAAALGAGIQAACGAGLYPDMRTAARAMTHIEPIPFEPDPVNHAFYSRLYEEVFINLYPSLQKYLSRLTKLAETHH
jgi:xylulokinase